MKELKKLTERELTRIRAIQQVSHQLAHMVNIILRKYPNNERYKGRNQLRLVLDNIDKRLSIYECKLNHNGGAIVGFYNNLPQYMDKALVISKSTTLMIIKAHYHSVIWKTTT